MASAHTGAAYSSCGSIAPLYIVLSASCFSPQFKHADLDNAFINFVHLSVVYFICSLKLNLLSIIIPRYLILSTCSNRLLFKYISIAFLPFRLLVISIVFDFWSMNCNLCSLAHYVILFISKLVKFSTSATVAAFTAISKSSANAIALVLFAKFRFNSELYWMFQYPGPQQDPWGHPLFTVVSILLLFVAIKADLSLK